MVTSTTPPANNFVKASRKVYNPLGFSKGYNFILWFIFAGALFGFTLARFEYLNFSGVFCSPTARGGNAASPGECYWYTSFPRYHAGIIIHLATILPAALLAILQFTPAIRHKAILYHRIAGYVAILLALVSIAGAFMIADRAFGGHISTTGGVGILGLGTVIGLGMAYWNIKRLRIDQHRAWMLRVWFWMGSIITLRIILIISALIVSNFPGRSFYQAMSCDELLFIANPTDPLSAATAKGVYAAYPGCEPGNERFAADGNVVVKASMTGTAAQVGTALDVSFGMALWVALALHAFGVELYLWLTQGESQRLKEISLRRREERWGKGFGVESGREKGTESEEEK